MVRVATPGVEAQRSAAAGITAARWQVRLLGTVQASHDGNTLQRFPSRAVAALLARLACAPERAHAREELIELLWPGVELDVGRNRLRQALSTLKGLLEAGAPADAGVIVADRVHVRVAAGAMASDVMAFERAVRAGDGPAALALYGGEFMPGFYDEWVDEERTRLLALYERIAGPSTPAAPGSGAPDVEQRLQPAPGASPAPAPVSALPHYLTRLFGAEEVLPALCTEVCEHRLVTLHGPGGSGKTRLSVEAAHRLAAGTAVPGGPAFERAVFVPMAQCATAPQALDALVRALQLNAGAADALQAAIEALAGRRVLLVLDNLEQLVEAVQTTLARLLGALPQLHVLATSRRVLGLDGEREHPVPALPLPPEDAGLAAVQANAAVAMFVERARAARADFHLSERNAPVLAALVRELEGMPLAIELAASRVRSISPPELLQRLRGTGAPRLALLARGGPRGALDARHASMQRVVQWSWDQLGPAPAQLLAALTVFPAGFDLACACVLAHDEGWDVPLLLDELVMHSLVNRRASPRPEGAEAKPESACADDAPPRFTLYQPIREFAAQQLDAAAAARWRARLRRWAVQWAAALPRTPPLAALREEMPNLVAALASALHDDEPTAAIEMLLALRRALEDVELPAEGLRLACLLVEREPDRRLAARGHTALGPLLFTAGQSEAALQHADRGLACDGLDAMQRARALHAAARVRLRSRFEVERVEPMLDEAERLLGPAPGVAGGAAAPAPDELELRASLLALRAFVFNRLHRRLAEGERLHERALALWERTGNQHAIASGRYNLAVCAQNADRHQDALDRLAPVIESARALGDRRRLSQSLNVRGNAHSGLHQWAEAVADYRECIAVAWRDLSSYDLAYGLWNLPRALLRLRRPEQAVPLAAYADLYWRTHFGALHDEDQRYLRRLRRLASRLVGEPRRQALAREGERLTLAEAVALALA